VTPDQVRLPSPDDLAAGRDVVLSYAVSLFGVTLDPVEAANLFRNEPGIKTKNEVAHRRISINRKTIVL
jgi:hypothetical protein